jgi:hypothetical protein
MHMSPYSGIGISANLTGSLQLPTSKWTKIPLKGAPKVKEVLAKNVPYALEAPKINFDRVFHTKAKTRSKLILEASRPGPLSPWGPLSKEILLMANILQHTDTFIDKE